jgi:hypothetical protein
MNKQFCCDMDGVLCDFIGGAIKIVNETLENRDNITDPELKETIEKAIEELGKTSVDKNDLRINTPNKNVRKLMKDLIRNNKDFWANLEWAKGGRVIWNAIAPYDPYILSAPMGKSAESKAGKIEWIKKNLTPQPGRIILDDDKWKHTDFDGKQGVLIDDMWFNIDEYREAGGIAIFHRDLRVTMGLIKKYANG